MAPGVLLFLLGLFLLVFGIGIIPLAFGFILAVIGGAIAFSLYKNAVASEAP